MSYDDSLRQEFLTLRDDLVTDFQADGLIFSEDEVKLATVTTTGADPTAGKPGTRSTAYSTIEPRPKVYRGDVFRWVDGAPVRTGDAKLTISRGVAESTLRSAAWFEIAGVKYTLVAGELVRSSNGLDWVLTLKRLER